MKIIAEQGREDLAKVYIALMRNNSDSYLVEFVESLQPPIPREEKWVIIVSSQFGCPVGCLMCDAGQEFIGNLKAEEIIDQIDYVIRKRFPDGKIEIPKFKIQFARMGEPMLNPAVLDVLEKLPSIYRAPNLIPCITTVAPRGSENFFERLRKIKQKLYHSGRFQLQFSINTTDEVKREKLIPFPKWGFSQISSYGESFMEKGDRKITLNFAIAQGYPVEPVIIRKYFNPEKFLIKLTPLNPTTQGTTNKLTTYINPENPDSGTDLTKAFNRYGYEIILSIGEPEENQIGSNCGKFVSIIKRNVTSNSKAILNTAL